MSSRSLGWPWRILRCVVSVALLAAVCVEQASLEAFGERVAAAVARGFEAGKPETLRTVLGERKSVVLPDDSELVLNTTTQVEVSIRKKSRDVTLVQGEALVNVSEDALRRPFVLHVGDGELQTTAAKALVRLERDGTTSIHVLTGDGWLRPAQPSGRRLAVDAYFRPVLLKAGQSVSMRSGVRIVTGFDAARVDRQLAWTQGEVWLEGETLSEAVAEFNRYNHQKIVVKDASIATLRVGGRFDAQDVDGFVSALGNTFDIQAVTVRSGGAGASTVMLVGAGRART